MNSKKAKWMRRLARMAADIIKVNADDVYGEIKWMDKQGKNRKEIEAEVHAFITYNLKQNKKSMNKVKS